MGIWPRSHEIQLNNGHAGDIWVIGTTIEIPNPEGRINDRRHLNLTDDSEKKLGEWNKLRIVCDGDELTIYVNDDKVNYASKLSQTKGRHFPAKRGGGDRVSQARVETAGEERMISRQGAKVAKKAGSR